MRLRNRVMPRFAPLRMGFAALALCGCGDDGGGSGGGESGGTGGVSTTSATGYEPDPEACEISKPCTVAADCCEGVQHPGTLPGITCPSSTYPHNWSCVVSGGAGHCVHGGCTVDSHCANLVPGLECMQVDGVGHCVAPCVNDDDCTTDQIMDATKCIGESDLGEDFCLEEPAVADGG